MSRLRVFAFAMLGWLSFYGLSFAAEHPPGVELPEDYEVYEEEVVDGLVAQPEYDWDGFYLGVQGGWARLHGDNRYNSSGTQYNGGTVGLYGGYNYTYQNFLIGAELEGAYWSFGERARDGMTLRSDYFAAAKIRGGLTYDWFMAYVNGGVALSTFRVRNPSLGTGSDDNTMVGYVGGAGVEMFVTEQIVVRLDYERIVFPGRRFTLGDTRFKENIDSDAIRIGISYKF